MKATEVLPIHPGVRHRSPLHASLPTLLLFVCAAMAMDKRAEYLHQSGLPLLTRIAQVRDLTPEEAQRGYSVRLRGVVTYADSREPDLFIQDTTAGTYVDTSNTKLALRAGQLVEVEGVTAVRGFVPQIAGARVRILGRRPLPAAKRASFSRLASLKEDSQWVEVEGIVHAASKQEDKLVLDVAVDGGRLKAQIPEFQNPIPAPLVDARVRVRGACAAHFNQKNQLTGVLLYVPDLQAVHVIELAADAFSLPVRRAASQLHLTPEGASGHRVRVQGVVTLQQPGRSLFLRGEQGGLRVHTSQRTPVKPGDHVDVVGFPVLAEYSMILGDAVYRVIRAGPPPAPTPVTAAQALVGSYDADRVRIQARLLDGTAGGPGGRVLHMEADGVIFVAQLETGWTRGSQATLAPGSLLQLTGICTVEADEDRNPRAFRILLGSADDLQVLESPPWWRIKNTAKTMTVMLSAICAVLLWVALLKRQVHAKTDLIREWLRREAALKTRYQELFENANDMVFTCDLEGRVVSLNKAGERTTGYSQVEALSMNFAQLVSPEYSDLARRAIEVEGAREKRSQEVEIVTKEGRRVGLELSTRLIYRDGKPVEVQGIARNITERRRLEEQLRQAQKMEAVGQLAGGIAHDFNNLLTIISGYSQLVLGSLRDNQRLQEWVCEIVRAADRAACLTRQLLAFSRRQVLKPQILDLNGVVASMDRMLLCLIGEHCDLAIVQGKQLGKVMADRGQIEQVIMNLAVNARDAMPEGGRLTIETSNVHLDETSAGAHFNVAPAPYVMLSVSDTGCGMDAETQAHMFEPFFTTKERGKGTGLGLATVYGIIAQSGGFITVDSAPGHGTTFNAFLPRAEGVATAAQSFKPDTTVARGSETVLLVEDEQTLRSLVRGILESNGYSVLEARHGKEAISVCGQHKGSIHLLLTDVIMPEMNGRELAEHLTPSHEGLKVLYMSGYADEVLGKQRVLDSSVSFIKKPFTPEALARRVREVLDGKPPQYVH